MSTETSSPDRAPRPRPERRSPPALSFDTPHRFLDVGHSRIATWSFGTGPDLVFVHGWPLSAATFRHVARELSGSFTCHLLDLPGAGRTEITEASPIELRAHAATLRAAVDALGVSRYALCAHDSGAFVARLVAAEDPRVVGLSLGNTEIPGHVPPMLVAYVMLARTGALGGRLLRSLLQSRAIRHSALGFGGCFTDPRYEEGEFHDLFVGPLIESPRAMAGAMKLLRSVNAGTLAGLEEVHAKIHVPVQLVWGTDDPWFPLAKARSMLTQFGGPATLVEIPGGKLLAHEDHAPELALHARGFFEDCFGGDHRAAS